jgi:hypothetical protein
MSNPVSAASSQLTCIHADTWSPSVARRYVKLWGWEPLPHGTEQLLHNILQTLCAAPHCTPPSELRACASPCLRPRRFRVCAPEGRVCSPAAPTRLRRRLLGLQYTLHEERSVTQSPPTESQLLSSGSCSSAGAGAGAAGRGNRLVVKINFTTLDATGATGRPPGAGAGV